MIFLRSIGRLVLLFLAVSSAGCGAGVAGLVVALISTGSGAGTSDRSPLIQELRFSAPETPDRIQIEFKLSNEDKGRLGARIDYEVAEDGTGVGSLFRATPVPGSELPAEARDGETIRFVWDAKGDLGDASKQVKVTVTPIEDGKERTARRWSRRPSGRGTRRSRSRT